MIIWHVVLYPRLVVRVNSQGKEETINSIFETCLKGTAE